MSDQHFNVKMKTALLSEKCREFYSLQNIDVLKDGMVFMVRNKINDITWAGQNRINKTTDYWDDFVAMATEALGDRVTEKVNHLTESQETIDAGLHALAEKMDGVVAV